MYIKRIFLISVLVVSVAFLTSCAKKPTVVTPPAVEKVHTIPKKPPEVRHDVYHEVAPAETIWRIGKTYNVKPEKILETNNIRKPDDIEAGEVLLIPNAYPRQTVIPLFNTNKWKYIVIHHSATDSGNSLFFDKIHHIRGFNRGIGYDFVIDNGTKGKEDGQIEVSPRWIKQIDGAHCNEAGMNQKGIGICLVGNFMSSRPTSKQMASLVKLVGVLMDYYDIPLSRVLGHGEVPGAATKCPGTNFPWSSFERRVRNRSKRNYASNEDSLQVIYVKK